MTLGIDYRTKSHDASHHQTTSTNTPTLTFQPTTTHHHPSHHPPPPPKAQQTPNLGSPAPSQKQIAGTNPVMEGRFSKKGREDMLCTMQSGYIASCGTFFSSTIMPVGDSKWGPPTSFISDD